MLVYPFVSRPKFFYFLVATWLPENLKNILKLILRNPRPQWVWSDINCFSCSTSFANPSGHAIDSAFWTLFLVLDLFHPSTNWMKTYPELHEGNPFNRKSKLLKYGLSFVLIGIYWPLIVMDRMVLGKHTMDEVFLGSQIGFWAALFSHYVIRDWLYQHITVVATGPRIEWTTFAKYAKIATLFIFLQYLLFCSLILGFHTYWTVP